MNLTTLTTQQKIGIAIGGVLGVMLLGYVWSTWAGWHAALDKDLESEKAKNATLTTAEQKAKRAQAKINELRARALPGDQENARVLYQNWLSSQFEQSGFRDLKLNPGPAAEHEKTYMVLDFRASGRANLKQLTELLHRFYAVNLLHRLQRISLTPLNDSKDLDVEVAVEAIMFVGAPKATKLTLEKSERTQGDLASYWETILNRNLLGPANRPPTLTRIDAQKVRKGDSLTVSPKASDPDGLDHLTFALDKAPPGATIDPKTGKVTWSRPANGNYEIVIKVADDGWPSKTAQQKFAVAVADPPSQPKLPIDTGPKVVIDPKPKWEAGRFTFITAVTEADGQPEAWFSIRTTGEVLRLREGDRFDVSGLKGTVAEIDGEEIVLEVLGKRYLVRLGDNLSQAAEVRAGGGTERVSSRPG